MEKNKELQVVKQGQLSKQIYEDGKLPRKDFLQKTYSYISLVQYPEEQLSLALGLLFTRVAVLAGIQNPISDFDKSDIKEAILMKYKGISLEEIDYAFRLERYNAYDTKTEHYQLFNADYVTQILNKYIKWRVVERKYIEPKRTALPEPSEDSQREILIQCLQDAVEHYRGTKEYRPAITFLYNFLYKENKLPSHTEEYKAQILIRATQSLKDEKALKRGKDILGIDKILKNIEDKNTTPTNKCREIIVKDFIRQAAENNKLLNF